MPINLYISKQVQKTQMRLYSFRGEANVESQSLALATDERVSEIGCADFKLPSLDSQIYWRVFGGRYGLELMTIIACCMTNPAFDARKKAHEITMVFDTLEQNNLLPRDHNACRVIMGSVVVGSVLAQPSRGAINNARQVSGIKRAAIREVSHASHTVLTSGWISLAEDILKHRANTGQTPVDLMPFDVPAEGFVFNTQANVVKRPTPYHALEGAPLYWEDEAAALKVAELLSDQLGAEVLDRQAFMDTFYMLTGAAIELITPEGAEDQFKIFVR